MEATELFKDQKITSLKKKNVKNEVPKLQDSYLPSWNQSLHHISVHWLNLWTKNILYHRNDTSWLRLDSLK